MNTPQATRKAGQDSSGWDLEFLDLILEVPKEQASTVAVPPLDLLQHGEQLCKKSSHMKQRWVPSICVLCVVGLFTWASLAKIDQVTRGHGKVIPSSKVQLIQSLVDGIILEIPVQEGDVVRKGQEVLKLDDTLATANYQEMVTRRDLVHARMVRLLAEANYFTEPEYPVDINDQVVALEQNLFAARRADYMAKKGSAEQLLDHTRKELDILKRGESSVTKLDVLQAEKAVAQLTGNLDTLISETKRNALDEHDRLRAEVASLDSALVRNKNILQRTVLRSPLDGTVNKIHITGNGRVVRGGESIMEIVPLNDSLLVEANIRPEDIGFIHSGQKSTVKFTAYEYTIYGGMEGVVEYIGVDTTINELGETYYPVRIRTESLSMGSSNGRKLSIIPGMVAEVDILAGQKSVLQYLLTPLNRAREKALSEQ